LNKAVVKKKAEFFSLFFAFFGEIMEKFFKNLLTVTGICIIIIIKKNLTDLVEKAR